MPNFPKHKFHAVRTEMNGESFPSKLEASVYQILQILEKVNKIKDLRRYPSYELIPGVKWKVDFEYFCLERQTLVAVEAKGVETSDYRIKKNIWKTFGPHVLEIYKGTHNKPLLHETIIPKGGSLVGTNF